MHCHPMYVCTEPNPLGMSTLVPAVIEAPVPKFEAAYPFSIVKCLKACCFAASDPVALYSSI